MSKAKLAAIGLTAAVGLVASFEGLRQYVYPDAVGIPTVCYGHTGPDVKYGTLKTRQECQNLLEADLWAAYDGMRYCTNVRLTEGERIAYTSFVFNVGGRAYCQSSLVRKLNAGDRVGACHELSKWIYAKRRPLPGLVSRRAEELRYCLRDLK